MRKHFVDALSSVPQDRDEMLRFMLNLNKEERELFEKIVVEGEYIRATETQITFEEFLLYVEPMKDSPDLYDHVRRLLFRLKPEDMEKLEKWANGDQTLPDQISQEEEDWTPDHIEDVD